MSVPDDFGIVCPHQRLQCPECRMAMDAREVEFERLNERDAGHTEARGILASERDAARCEATANATEALQWRQRARDLEVALESARYELDRLTGGLVTQRPPRA